MDQSRKYHVDSEAAEIAVIAKTIAELHAQRFPPGTRALRDAHPKTTLVAYGCLRVKKDLYPWLKVGLAAQERCYPVLARFSNANMAVNSDDRVDGRGFSLKVFDVPGPKLLKGEEDGTTLDILLSSFPAFFGGGVHEYHELVDSVKQHHMLQFFLNLRHPHRLRPLRNFLLRQGGVLKTLRRTASVWDTTYWSQEPFAWGVGAGSRAIKWKMLPLSSQPVVPFDYDPMPDDYKFNRLRWDGAEQIRSGPATFALQVQFQLDPVAMPIDDSTKIWSERRSPPLTIATVEFSQQPNGLMGLSAFFDYVRSNVELVEPHRFSPWRTIAEHAPLGPTNAVRREAYDVIFKQRSDLNHVADRSEIELPPGCPLAG
jgi:hypothetical protein